MRINSIVIFLRWWTEKLSKIIYQNETVLSQPCDIDFV